MSEGGYSRLEKDFLGNERMVHYDGSGNMLGASDVVREPDGTIRIPNEKGASFVADDLPKVEAVEPKPKAAVQDPVPSVAMKPKSNVPMNQVVLYSIATFIGAMLLTLGIASFVASRRSPQPISSTQIRNSNPMEDARVLQDPPRIREDDQQRDEFPNDPKPRNDEQPNDEPKPFDNAAPDMNSGDDLHPKIEPGDGDKRPSVEPDSDKDKPKTNGSDDPIDLRGDGGGTTKKGPANTSDPDDIH